MMRDVWFVAFAATELSKVFAASGDRKNRRFESELVLVIRAYIYIYMVTTCGP